MGSFLLTRYDGLKSNDVAFVLLDEATIAGRSKYTVNEHNSFYAIYNLYLMNWHGLASSECWAGHAVLICQSRALEIVKFTKEFGSWQSFATGFS